jgi:hypothetical protein
VRCEDRVQERQTEPAAKKRPERVVLPTLGRRRWPELDGAGEDGEKQKRVQSRQRGKGHVKDEVCKKQHRKAGYKYCRTHALALTGCAPGSTPPAQQTLPILSNEASFQPSQVRARIEKKSHFRMLQSRIWLCPSRDGDRRDPLAHPETLLVRINRRYFSRHICPWRSRSHGRCRAPSLRVRNRGQCEVPLSAKPWPNPKHS